MRIKFNDKIYRLKEIESGVDSLMELVEEPRYKHGDFLMTRNRIAFILDREGKNGEAHHLFAIDIDDISRKYIQDAGEYAHCSYIKDCTIADQKAIKIIHDGLKSIGKRWNAGKKCIEDITVYKDGDFVVGIGCIFILHTQIDKQSAQYHVLYEKTNGMLHYGKTYFQLCGTDRLRLATEAEKQELLDALAKEGKRWNTEKKCIEDIPKRKFKVGDKVKIKDGISSKTHKPIPPYFPNAMDEFIGKELIVKEYTSIGWIVFYEDDYGYQFHEDWLEPWIEEPKKGDLAIFWDNGTSYAIIRVYDRKYCNIYYDILGNPWKNAIKFESKEQFKKVMKGEL